jgi:nucleoside-diphosphate-sugar epimerase
VKVLLTGITGNIGHEVALELRGRGVKIIPLVRGDKVASLNSLTVPFENIVESDLVSGKDEITLPVDIDAIVHTAGVVRFDSADHQNEKMMERIVALAKTAHVPVFAVSTAYVYRPQGAEKLFNNGYEADKHQAEEVLIASGIPNTILRPAVVTGHSKTGAIQNFNGYYKVVAAFVSAALEAKANKRKARFPFMPGESQLVPVDQVAQSITKCIVESKIGEVLYVTNPAPPSSEWVLQETLSYFGVADQIQILPLSFQEFAALPLTPEENKLAEFAKYFAPYWSLDYSFPPSVCAENLINREYVHKILKWYKERAPLPYAARRH